MDNKRLQLLYQKTDYNNYKICQLNSILICCKCKKNNTIIFNNNQISQLCVFCGTPNYVTKGTNK